MVRATEVVALKVLECHLESVNFSLSCTSRYVSSICVTSNGCHSRLVTSRVKLKAANVRNKSTTSLDSYFCLQQTVMGSALTGLDMQAKVQIKQSDHLIASALARAYINCTISELLW